MFQPLRVPQPWTIFSGWLPHSHLPARFLSPHSWAFSLLFILLVSSPSTPFIFTYFPLCFFPGPSSFHPRVISSPGWPIQRSLMLVLPVAMIPGAFCSYLSSSTNQTVSLCHPCTQGRCCHLGDREIPISLGRPGPNASGVGFWLRNSLTPRL